MERPTVQRSGFLTFLPLSILAVGLAVRLVLAPLLEYPFDQTYWSIVIANAEAGYGLYGLPGYFYTPVWGYILGFDGLVMNAFTGLGEMGYRFAELAGIEDLIKPYFSATVSTPAFSLFIKLPMILVDVVVGYIVYRMVSSRTGSERSAAIAFALWFLCPVVVYMSAVQAQFDCISALLALLSLLLLEKDRPFLAGMAFGIAALTKLFPAFLILVLAIYVFKKHPGKTGLRSLALAVAGALLAFVLIYAPQLADGTVAESLSFVFSRATETSLARTVMVFAMVGISGLVVLAAAVRYHRLPADAAVRDLRRFALVTLLGAAFMSSGPQYCIVCMPLLAFYALSEDRSLVPWTIMLGTFATISAFFNNGLSLLAMGSEYLGFMDPSSLIGIMDAMDVPVFGGTTIRDVPVLIGDLGTSGCLLAIAAFVWMGKRDSASGGRLAEAVIRLKRLGRSANDS